MPCRREGAQGNAGKGYVTNEHSPKANSGCWLVLCRKQQGGGEIETIDSSILPATAVIREWNRGGQVLACLQV